MEAAFLKEVDSKKEEADFLKEDVQDATAGDGTAAFCDEQGMQQDDSWPLVAARRPFNPPNWAAPHLLHLSVGQLVRVRSLLDAPMLEGFLMDDPRTDGWF